MKEDYERGYDNDKANCRERHLAYCPCPCISYESLCKFFCPSTLDKIPLSLSLFFFKSNIYRQCFQFQSVNFNSFLNKIKDDDVFHLKIKKSTNKNYNKIKQENQKKKKSDDQHAWTHQ